MSKLYIFEIASALIGVLLIVADCRQMMIERPNAPYWAAMQRTPDLAYLSSDQAARIQRADVIDQLNGFSMLVSASAARSLLIAQ